MIFWILLFQILNECIVDKLVSLPLDVISPSEVDITRHKLFDFSSEISESIILKSWSADTPDVVVKRALGVSSRDFSLSTEPGRISLVRPLSLVAEVVKIPSAAVRSSSRNTVHESYLREFRRTAKYDFLEYGNYTRCDELIGLWFSDLGQSLGPIINHIFLKSFKDKQSILLLLKAVSNLPYVDVEPYGQVQALAYLPMEDDELAELMKGLGSEGCPPAIQPRW